MNHELREGKIEKTKKLGFFDVIRNSLFILRVKTDSAGFTLVELLVSISIFVVITTLAVYNNGKFNSSILLTNLSYEIGLSVRQAQFYGISVKTTAATTFTSAYGVHFDKNSTTYTLFEDTDNLGTYNAGDVVVQTFTIRKGNTVGKIHLGSSVDCSVPADCPNSVDISFKRPDPDAIIQSSGAWSKAEVCVASPEGLKRKVVIEKTGQISINSTNTTICN